MDVYAIFGTQFFLSLVVLGLVVAWYVNPWLNRQTSHDPLFWLTLPHAFRYLGLVFLVPGVVAPSLPSIFATPGDCADHGRPRKKAESSEQIRSPRPRLDTACSGGAELPVLDLAGEGVLRPNGGREECSGHPLAGCRARRVRANSRRGRGRPARHGSGLRALSKQVRRRVIDAYSRACNLRNLPFVAR